MAENLKHRGISWWFALPYKATFYPPIVYLRPLIAAILKKCIAQWFVLGQLLKGIQIHWSLDLRSSIANLSKAKIGEATAIESQCTIWLADEPEANPQLTVGKAVFIGRNSYIGVFHPVTIGGKTIVGAYSYIISGDHAIADLKVPVRDQGYVGKAIHIGANVWLGCHVVVLKGVTIGEGAVVAAGAVVTSDIPAFEIWGGVPAKKIGSRKSVENS